MSAILTIDNQTITSEEFLLLLDKYHLLPHLAREVIIDHAITNIDCTKEELTQACQQFFEQYRINTDSQINNWLQQQKMTWEQFQFQLERKLKLEKFKQDNWGRKIESYFLKCQQLDQVLYSLIKVQEAGVANELYFRIQEKESSFTELAQQYSQGPEALTGGLIGPVELSTLPPLIAQMLHSSEPGQLLPPTEIGDSWVIIRLEQLIHARLDQAMRQRLLDEQFQLWLVEQVQRKVSIA